MGCAAISNHCKVQRSTAVEIFNEEQAKSIIGAKVVNFKHDGRPAKLYYKQLSGCTKK
jgi:hypothetical protein